MKSPNLQEENPYPILCKTYTICKNVIPFSDGKGMTFLL